MRTFSIVFRALSCIIGALLLLGWMATRARAWDRRLGIFWPAWMEMPGILLTLGGGIFISLCCEILIEHGQGTPCIFYPPKEFVVVGPYQYVRNPIYIGEVIMIIGVGLFFHSVSILLFAGVWFFLLHLLVIYYEEPRLKRKFGPSYAAYSQTVRRWIPRLSVAKGTSKSCEG